MWDEDKQQYVDANGDPFTADELEEIGIDPDLRNAPEEDIPYYDRREQRALRDQRIAEDAGKAFDAYEEAALKIPHDDAGWEDFVKDLKRDPEAAGMEAAGMWAQQNGEWIDNMDPDLRDAIVERVADWIDGLDPKKKPNRSPLQRSQEKESSKKPNIDGIFWDPVNDEYVDADGNGIEADELVARGLDPDGVDVPAGVPDYEGNLNPIDRGSNPDILPEAQDSEAWEANRAKQNAVLENREVIANDIEKALAEGKIDDAKRMLGDLEEALKHHDEEIDGGADNSEYMKDVDDLGKVVNGLTDAIAKAEADKKNKPNAQVDDVRKRVDKAIADGTMDDLTAMQIEVDAKIKMFEDLRDVAEGDARAAFDADVAALRAEKDRIQKDMIRRFNGEEAAAEPAPAEPEPGNQSNPLFDEWAQGIAEAPGGWADVFMPEANQEPHDEKEIARVNDIFDRAVAKAGDDDALKQRIEDERQRYLKAVGAAESAPKEPTAKPISEPRPPAAPEPPAKPAKKPVKPRKPKDDVPVREPGMTTAEYERVKREAAENKKIQREVDKKMAEADAKVEAAKKMDDERAVLRAYNELYGLRDKHKTNARKWNREERLKKKDRALVAAYDERVQAVRDHLDALKARPPEIRFAQKAKEVEAANIARINRMQGVQAQVDEIDRMLEDNRRIAGQDWRDIEYRHLAQKGIEQLEKMKADLMPRLKIEQEYNDRVAGRAGAAKDVLDQHLKDVASLKMTMANDVEPDFDSLIKSHEDRLADATEKLAKIGNPPDSDGQLAKAELEGLVSAHTRSLGQLNSMKRSYETRQRRIANGENPDGLDFLPGLGYEPAKPKDPILPKPDEIEGAAVGPRVITNPNIKTKEDAAKHIADGGSLDEVPNDFMLHAIMENALQPDGNGNYPDEQGPKKRFLAIPKESGNIGTTYIMLLRDDEGRPLAQGVVLKSGPARDNVMELMAYNMAAEHGLMPEGAMWDGEGVDRNGRTSRFVVIPHAFNALPEAADGTMPKRSGARSKYGGRAEYDPRLIAGKVEWNGEQIEVDPTQAQAAYLGHFLHNYLAGVNDRHDKNGMTVVVNGKLYVIPIDQGWAAVGQMGGRQYHAFHDMAPEDYARQLFDMHPRILDDIGSFTRRLPADQRAAHAQALTEVMDDMIARAEELAKRPLAEYERIYLNGVSDADAPALRAYVGEMHRVYGLRLAKLKQDRLALLQKMGVA